jgi:hypothetical protein
MRSNTWKTNANVGWVGWVKMFYGAKHALGVFTTVKTTNVISLVISPVSLPQHVYRSSTQFHPTIKTNAK